MDGLLVDSEYRTSYRCPAIRNSGADGNFLEGSGVDTETRSAHRASDVRPGTNQLEGHDTALIMVEAIPT